MEPKISHILLTTDLSDASFEAFPYAVRMARENGATLTCLFCLSLPEPVWVDLGFQVTPTPEGFETSARQELKKVVEQRIGEILVPVDSVVVKGDPLREIIDYADKHEIDLIVMSTHGRTGLKHVLLGSVAERVVRHASCPVLTVPCEKG